MFTEIKNRKDWEDLFTPNPDKKLAEGFEQELIGYNFLRNIWGTYFFDRQDVGSEDKLDRINKIVGMMKAQVKLMITHESNLTQGITKHSSQQKDSESARFLQVELERAKQALERSRMREEELHAGLLAKHTIIQSLQKQNHDLKAQVFDLKQAKNRCEERIIDLSNQVYQLERGHFLNISGDCSRFDQANNTLDQYSAISIDRQDQKDRPRVSLFSKRDLLSLDLDSALNEEIRSEQHDSKEKQQLCSDLRLDPPRRNPLKQSLQFFNRDQSNQQDQSHLIQEMKKIKQMTERIMQVQNDRFSQRQGHARRNTFTNMPSQRPSLNIAIPVNEPRRFKRIRC